MALVIADFNYAELLSDFQEKGAAASGQKKNWAYLGEGNHLGRLLVDNGNPRKFLRRTCVHTFGHIYTLCPDDLADKDKAHAGDYPICKFCEIYEERKTKNLNKRWQTLMYFYLIQTNKPNPKYWNPNTLYVIVANNKLYKFFTEIMREDPKDPELAPLLQVALNPLYPGPAFNIKKDAKGDMSLSVTYHKKYPAIEMTEEMGYGDLDDAYVSAKWSLSKYERDVAELQKELDKMYIGQLPVDMQAAAKASLATDDVPKPADVVAAIQEDARKVAMVVPTERVELPVVFHMPQHMAPLPEGFEAPEGCPGYSLYDVDAKDSKGDDVCVMCDWSLSCMKAKQKREAA